MYSEKAQKALLPERLLGFLCFVFCFCWGGVGRFGRENMDTLELVMIKTVFELKKMNTLDLFMVSINIPPHCRAIFRNHRSRHPTNPRGCSFG